MANILYVFAWDSTVKNNLLNLLADNAYDEIHFYYYVEYDIHIDPLLVDIINQKNIKIKIVTCGFETDYLEKRLEWQQVKKDLIEIQLWPTYWFNNTFKEIIKSNEVYKNFTVKHFNKPFLTFNNVVRKHRTLLIDKLYEKNLLDKGIVTYHQERAEKHPEHIAWRSYPGKILTVDDPYVDDQGIKNSYLFNEIFLTSFLHIPTETSIETPFISEKTATPILAKLPFLTLSAPKFHTKVLQELGFKLYDEIFDYSFDLEEDLELRIEKLLKNVELVINHPNLDELYKIIKPKIDYNFDIAMQYIFVNKSVIPEMILQKFDKMENSLLNIEGYDYELNEIRTLLCYKESKCYHVWEPANDIEQIINDIQTEKPRHIKIFGEPEHEIFLSENLVTALNDNNVELTVIHGAFNDPYYEIFYRNQRINNLKVEYWPTYWMHQDEHLLKATLDIKTYEQDTNFQSLFINLNNKAHPHRCALIDQLSIKGLINDGVVTWHNFLNYANYDFKHFNNRILKLNDDFDKKLDPFELPYEFYHTFFHLVSESTDKVTFITEKTILPIMFKKPFLSMATPYFHEKLVSLGFVLYDELFDYSFDKEHNREKRADLLTENLYRIKGKNLTELYQMLLPKLTHNYNNFFNIIKTKKYIPLEIYKRYLLLTHVKDFSRLGADENYIRIFKRIEELND